MEWPLGRSTGHGYGTYTVTAKITSNGEPGAAIVLWPADDVWPGGELDMAETAADGSSRLYGTVHWRKDDGGNGFQSTFYDGIDPNAVHTFVLTWAPGRVSYSVDGKDMGSVTTRIGADAANGGVNVTIGALNNNPNTSITLYDVSYTPLASVPAPPPTPPPATGGIVPDATGTARGTAGADVFVATGKLTLINGFDPARDVLAVPVNPTTVRAYADWDFASPEGASWGMRVTWDGGSAFLRWGSRFDPAKNAVRAGTAPPPAPVPAPAPGRITPDATGTARGTAGADVFATLPRAVTLINGFDTSKDMLALPPGVASSAARIFADWDRSSPEGAAWGVRVAWGDGSAFLRWGYGLDARSLISG
ncbi:family 16 glycosylhydrolase [Rhodovastum atsumiense]|nr:family 16 glycosylhydrolase [Rhodovastum atsumiense]